MKKKILVVDDDADIVRLISDSLQYEQFDVETAHSGKEALEKIASESIDFLILDIMMPGMDGYEVCRRIRQDHDFPILFLSAKDRDFDKVIGLEIGGDDYMTKPFSIQELTSRIKAHFRKMDRLYQNLIPADKGQEQTEAASRQSPSALHINEKTYEASLNGEKLDLSTREFQILFFLQQHPHQVLSREQIYESIWGDEFGEMNTVTVHIKNIRKKLGEKKEAIKTIWGVGYKFVPEVLGE
ncbi:response regulator transcription factor [Falsibacillus albus]|uniref:DNA-binding response regulator n=1 Tax=Falsibacillus albus TaxID=2478915 RepID=A0A3L7JUX1_9BACI|nr:response regulator transcription factor [Falsibacillus albus]RLQ94536.1 DNA-binding response regulator [Falsibacillus albus]